MSENNTQPTQQRAAAHQAAAAVASAQKRTEGDVVAAAEELTKAAEVAEVAEAAAPSAPTEARSLVVLVGPPGAGKSTIGRRLARALNAECVDSDKLIEAGTHKSCGELFMELGEPAFRELEAQYVAEALDNRAVISLGGGAVLSAATRELLGDHIVVWIDVSAEEGARRTEGENTRPVLQAADPLAHYRSLLEERAPLYKQVANYRARTDGRSPQQVVADILGFLESTT